VPTTGGKAFEERLGGGLRIGVEGLWIELASEGKDTLLGHFVACAFEAVTDGDVF